jgi:hypothetical protein
VCWGVKKTTLKKSKHGGVHVLIANTMVFHINVKNVKLYSVNPVSNLDDVHGKHVVSQRQNQIKGDSQLSARSRSGCPGSLFALQ